MFCHGVLEECFELNGTFRMLDAPAHHAAAEDVEDDVEIEVGPFHRPHQFGDVPGPHLIWPFGQELGLLIDRVATLAAAFDDLALTCKDAIHRADRTQIDAFIEQGGVDLGRGLIREAGCAQMGKHLISLIFRQGARDRMTLFCRAGRGEKRHAVPMHRGPRHLQACANGRRQAAARRQSHNGGHHDLPLLPDACSISSRSAATFFWMAMIASA